jgi:FkbM family methyltransferase
MNKDNNNSWYRKIIESIFPLETRAKLLKLLNGSHYPYIYEFSDLGGNSCVFEISGPVEEFRVKKMGGETEYTKRILREINRDDIVYDIGSCVGMVAIPAMLIGAEVVCFEPDPSIRKRLENNLKLNNLDDGPMIIEWAVTDDQGEIELYSEGINGVSPSLVMTKKRKSITVPADSIDNALAQGSLPVPTIIKMDIEGAEGPATKGMVKLLSSENAPRLLFLELHPSNLHLLGYDESEYIQLIESFGYGLVYKIERFQQIHTIFKKMSTEKKHSE